MKEFEKIDYQAVRVPGVLTAQYTQGENLSPSCICKNWMQDEWSSELSGADSIEVASPHFQQIVANFMNDPYFADSLPCFITSSPLKGGFTADKLTAALKKAVHEACLELKGSFIRTIILDRSGGLHCMTSVMET